MTPAAARQASSPLPALPAQDPPPAVPSPAPPVPPKARQWPWHSLLELGALPGAVPCARLHARQVLWEWSLGDLREPAELVVSELVTNAVRASAATGWYQPVRLRLLSDGACVEVRVWDGNPTPPRQVAPGELDEAGRGLMVVEAVSVAWHWYPGNGGKEVWAVLGSHPAGDGQSGDNNGLRG